MRYRGIHFRLARAAIGVSISNLCKELRMSPMTIDKIEKSGEIKTFSYDDLGRPEKGMVSDRRILALAEYYKNLGIEFLPQTITKGAGIRVKKEEDNGK